MPTTKVQFSAVGVQFPVGHEPAPHETKVGRPIRLTAADASGQCVAAAAEVFDQRDEDGIVVLLDPNPPAELAADVDQAAAVCPALAIRIEH